MPRRLVGLLAALSILSVMLWWLPNRPQAGDVAMPDTKFDSVSFAPFRSGQSPLQGRFPTAEQVDADLALLAGRTRAIRTYAAIEGDYDTPALARAHGLKLWQGIWLGADRAQNAREIARGIALTRRYPDTIERVVVGNEVLLRGDLPPDAVIAALDQVRAAVRQPVTYADVWEYWQRFPQIAAHVDLITIHLLPYWEDHPIGVDRAMAQLGDEYQRIAQLFPGRRIAIGETGWPSRGRWRRDAAPGVVNQALFLRRFIALSHQQGFDYNLIEAFDQDWKFGNEGVVGANWGLFTADRVAKFPLAGPVIEDPGWPQHAALHLVLAMLLLGFARGGARRPLGAGPIVAAFALAGGLAFAQAATAPELYDIHLRLAAVANLGGQALLAGLLMQRLVGGLPPSTRTGAQSMETARCLLRLHWPAGWRAWLFDDLGFVFVWTAAVLQWLLVVDPRYRDFPLAAFAVPLLAVPIRAAAGDLPTRGGGGQEALVGVALAVGAVASAIREGSLNRQSLIWNAAALLLAAPLLLRCYRRDHAGQPSIQTEAPSATPTIPQVTL